MEGTSSSAESVIEILRGRGWCFGDVDQLKALVAIQSTLFGSGEARAIVESVEAELLKMDIKSFGGKFLPDLIQLKRTSFVQGPKILQINSARDITRSSIEYLSGSSSSRRLLRLNLTDGHTEIIALEYCRIPSIPEDIIPGTKLRIENRAAIHNGIVCLTPKEVTVLGGVVPTLYEEWQMKKKYSSLSRASERQSQERKNGGPPLFEELQIGIPSHQHATQGCRGPKFGDTSSILEESKEPNIYTKGNNRDANRETISVKEEIKEKPSSSETRPKQVIDAIPVQNQAAAQKLLQKMKQPSSKDMQCRGRKHRGKGREEDDRMVFTLDEWEKRNSGVVLPGNEFPDVSQDEDLAWRLQSQFDLEDSHVQEGAHGTGAEDIRMNMFNYQRVENDDRGRGRGRGRGSGRGRGRGRGGGRGRGRG